MKRWVLKGLCVVSLITLFVGCGRGEDSAEVNQDSVYAVYEAFYKENDDVTQIIARFRFGGPFS